MRNRDVLAATAACFSYQDLSGPDEAVQSVRAIRGASAVAEEFEKLKTRDFVSGQRGPLAMIKKRSARVNRSGQDARARADLSRRCKSLGDALERANRGARPARLIFYRFSVARDRRPEEEHRGSINAQEPRDFRRDRER